MTMLQLHGLLTMAVCYDMALQLLCFFLCNVVSSLLAICPPWRMYCISSFLLNCVSISRSSDWEFLYLSLEAFQIILKGWFVSFLERGRKRNFGDSAPTWLPHQGALKRVYDEICIMVFSALKYQEPLAPDIFCCLLTRFPTCCGFNRAQFLLCLSSSLSSHSSPSIQRNTAANSLPSFPAYLAQSLHCLNTSEGSRNVW